MLKNVEHLSPLEYVIRAFGGVRATARAVLGDEERANMVSQWRRREKLRKRSTGGQVPAYLHATILIKAREMGKDITAEDLIFGRSVAAKESA